MATTRKLLDTTRAAQALGISRGTLNRCKRLGCPHHFGKFDVEEVKAWRLTRSAGPSIKNANKELREQEPTPGTAKALTQDVRDELAELSKALEHGEGIDGALQRLRCMEREAYRAYLVAHEQNNVIHQQIRLKLHSDITQHLLKAESLIDVRTQLSAEVWSEVEQELVRWSEPVRALIDQMPRSMASRCNVSDPAQAESALRDWVNGQLYPMLNRKPKS